MIQSKGFAVGSLVAPVWPGTVGDSAMGDQAARDKFEAIAVPPVALPKSSTNTECKYGVIRIDSAEFGVEKWRADEGDIRKIAETFRQAAKIAADHGERLLPKERSAGWHVQLGATC
ncbi:MAG: hypothetical protein U0892_03585 [Pirellulales bacterium]